MDARWETVTVHPGLGYSLMVSWCLPLSTPWSEATTSFDSGSGPKGAFQSSSSCLYPHELPGGGGGGFHAGACRWSIMSNEDLLFLPSSSSSKLLLLSFLILSISSCSLPETPKPGNSNFLSTSILPRNGCSHFYLTNSFKLGSKVYIASLDVHEDLLVGGNQILEASI